MRLSTILFIGIAITVVSMLSMGLFFAARRAGLHGTRAKSLGLATATGTMLWLTFTGLLAESGWTAVWSSLPPRIPLLLLAAIVSFVLLGRTRLFKQLVTATPLAWPVAFESFRVLVELGFWQMYREGQAPIQVTFLGTNHDGWVGLSAPIVAIGVGMGWIGKRFLIGWNLLGLAMLGTAIWSTATSLPGPLYLDWPGEPFFAMGSWPAIWIPAFFAPCALWMHLTSMRQLLSGSANKHPSLLSSQEMAGQRHG